MREIDGNVWVYFGDDPAAAPAIPQLQGFAAAATPQVAESVRFDATYDHAVIGLMDPAHVPFVHRSWFFRSGRAFAEKEKSFAPARHGFAMERHATSSNSRAYKLLGAGVMETDIAFTLPGVRVEHTSVGRHNFVNMTAMTPIDDETVELNNCIYWTMPWLSLCARRCCRSSANSSGRTAMRLAVSRKDLNIILLMLVGDAGSQARWYYRLKREYCSARAENRPFENPVEPRTLRWRS